MFQVLYGCNIVNMINNKQTSEVVMVSEERRRRWSVQEGLRWSRKPTRRA